jgi:HTH-type transcriptional regulator/antitoxin HigA
MPPRLVKETVRSPKKGGARSPVKVGRMQAIKVRVIKVRVPAGSRITSSYLTLVAAFPIRRLLSDTDLDQAIAVIDKLMSRRKPLDSQEQEYFDSLSHEIARYEAEAHPMPAVSGPDMLRHLIDAREVRLSEVAEASGVALSTLSSILAGKRKLTVGHISKLAKYFGVAQAVFLP